MYINMKTHKHSFLVLSAWIHRSLVRVTYPAKESGCVLCAWGQYYKCSLHSRMLVVDSFPCSHTLLDSATA